MKPALAMKGVQIIGISGPAKSGKSVLGRGLEGLGFRCYSFASPLKMMLAQLPNLNDIFALSAEKKEQIIPLYGKSARQMMQTLGTEWARNLVHPDIWVRIAADKIQNKIDMQISRKFVFDDLRFENEAEYIRQNGGLIVRILRSGAGTPSVHSSEAGFSVADGDLSVMNDGTLEDFEKNIPLIAETIEERVASVVASS